MIGNLCLLPLLLTLPLVFMKDVGWIMSVFKALLPHCLLKYLLERRWAQHTHYFSSPSDQSLELRSEFDGQVLKPCCDAITNNRFNDCPVGQYHNAFIYSMDPEPSQKMTDS